MAPRNPNDPVRPGMQADDRRAPSQFDHELQADPESKQGPATAGRIAAFAVAIVVVFAAVFYGLNTSSLDPKDEAIVIPNPPETSAGQTAQTAPATDPAAPAATPGINRQPGTTTGAAPSRDNAAPPVPPTADGTTSPTGPAGSQGTK
ncbi:hypothetical protein SR870_08055 [Rhodopseudomonas palustris]|uniref:hypothetical protein n=1 Tax=Rhodopseudomonas palustris TaxID=1076 RepID=UPI002ACE7C55|nr:hypothetical protein [Rhodopseudomonas palustris]WQH01212.1 hypothetical protein SR870_08055 [Rhodopseudomonas palustris]